MVASPPSSRDVGRDRRVERRAIASRKSVVRDPSGMLAVATKGSPRRRHVRSRRRAAAGPGTRASGARPAGGGRARRARRRPRRPRRARRRQDGAARRRGREGRDAPESSAPPASRARWSSRSPRVQQLVRADPRARRAPAASAARRARRRVRARVRGRRPNPFLVGARGPRSAVGGGRERGLLCVVDDAQWLDRASAQALGVRRLAGCWRSGSRSCSRPGSAARRSRGLARAPRRAARTSRRADPPGVRPAGSRWTTRCSSGSSSRRAGIRSRCWSCRAA